jgi:hypothetical protein
MAILFLAAFTCPGWWALWLPFVTFIPVGGWGRAMCEPGYLDLCGLVWVVAGFLAVVVGLPVAFVGTWLGHRLRRRGKREPRSTTRGAQLGIFALGGAVASVFIYFVYPIMGATVDGPGRTPERSQAEQPLRYTYAITLTDGSGLRVSSVSLGDELNVTVSSPNLPQRNTVPFELCVDQANGPFCTRERLDGRDSYEVAWVVDPGEGVKGRFRLSIKVQGREVATATASFAG